MEGGEMKFTSIIILTLLSFASLLAIRYFIVPQNYQEVWYEENITGISGCGVSTDTRDGLDCCYGGCGFLGGCDFEHYCEIGDRIRYRCVEETYWDGSTDEDCYWNVIVISEEEK